jgi:hypothetical protein
LLKKYNYTILNAGLFETSELITTTAINSAEEMPRIGGTQNIIAY